MDLSNADSEPQKLDLFANVFPNRASVVITNIPIYVRFPGTWNSTMREVTIWWSNETASGSGLAHNVTKHSFQGKVPSFTSVPIQEKGPTLALHVRSGSSTPARWWNIRLTTFWHIELFIAIARTFDDHDWYPFQVIHQAVRPFTCLLCRRGFNQKVALQRHERTHGQIAPTFKCKYCPKTFLVGSSLQAHEKIHSGIKPYTCQYCPSRFHTSAAQRQHERVHTNERPYSCSYCPKAFKDSGK